MTWPTLQELSRRMAEVDFAMLVTRTEGGGASARPMSNNGDVEDHGVSHFFAFRSSRKVAEIEADPDVMLSYAGAGGGTGGPPLFVAVSGKAELIDDRRVFEEHWTTGLGHYFPEGVGTPGLVMIRVRAERIRFWSEGDEGEIVL